MKTTPLDDAQAKLAGAGGRSMRDESWKRHAAALLCLGCLSGCSNSTDSRDVPPASSVVTASSSTPSPTTSAIPNTGGTSPSPSHSTSETTNQAGDLLLAQQTQTVVGGDGQGPDCRHYHPDGSPAAYISDGLDSPGDAAMLEHVGRPTPPQPQTALVAAIESPRCVRRLRSLGRLESCQETRAGGTRLS
jgi:hypothetical protein